MGDLEINGLNANQNAPLLSVVVPIYGVEVWLPEFLDSLIAQTFKDWRAILVIDGSTDGSLAVAERYALLDSRLSVKVFENGGLGRARNRGLDLATGTYVAFPDPDDVLTPDAYESLIASLLQSGSDIATGIGEDFNEDGVRHRYWAQKLSMFAEGGEGVSIATQPELVLDHVAWNKVFRTTLLRDEGIRYPEDTVCEDVVHSIRAYLAAGAVDVVPRVIYGHRRRATAITSNIMGSKIIEDWITQLRLAASLVLESGTEETVNIFFRRLLASEAWSRVCQFNRIPEEGTFARFEEFIRELMELAPAETIEELPALTRSALHFTAGGGLSRAWRVDGFGLNPFSNISGSLANSFATVARCARRLDASALGEEELRRLLISERVLGPLLASACSVDRDDVSAASSALRSLWPQGAPGAELAMFTLGDRHLLEAALVSDFERMVSLIETNLGRSSALLVGFKRHAQDILVTGELNVRGRLDDSARLELIVESSASGERSSLRIARWWVPTSAHTLRWRAVIPTSTQGEATVWQAWVRISRPGLSSRWVPVNLAPGGDVPFVQTESYSAKVLPGSRLRIQFTPRIDDRVQADYVVEAHVQGAGMRRRMWKSRFGGPDIMDSSVVQTSDSSSRPR